MTRSWLFVPGDSVRKLEKAGGSGADVLIIDLEDSVAIDAKAQARKTAVEYLSERAGSEGPELYVRVNATDTGLTDDDLAAVLPGRPAGIVLPKACGIDSARRLAAQLSTLEEGHGLDDGAIKILPIATETAASMQAIASWNEPLPRLAGLTWGAEDLSADLGIASPRDETGTYTDVFRQARMATIVAAGACRCEAIDTVYVDFRDENGLAAECRHAARDGFTGKLAIHPAQVAAINAAFAVSAEAVAEAKVVVAAFAEAGNPGVVAIGGKMYDRPHLRRAERILARAGQNT